MKDSNQGGALGEGTGCTDGGRDPVTAGDDPPPVPSGARGLVRRFLPDGSTSGRYHVLRVSLDGETGGEGVARSLVSELGSEVDVLGATHDDEGKPERPSMFSVVVEMDYDPAIVVDALAEPAPVTGVTATQIEVGPDAEGEGATTNEDASGTTDDGGDGDVTGADESAVSEAIEAVDTGATEGDDGDEGPDEAEEGHSDAVTADAGDDAPADSAEGVAADSGDAVPEDPTAGSTEDGNPGEAAADAGAPGDEAGATGDDTATDPAGDAAGAARGPTDGEDDEGPAGSDDGRAKVAGASSPAGARGNGTEPETANHPTFEELKADVEPVSYDSLVDELESTTLPGEFEDSADLEPVLSDEGAGAPGEGTAAQADAGADDGGGVTLEAGTREGDATVSRDAVVEALVGAIEADALSEGQRRTLADAVSQGQPKTMQVKIDHLQREVDELTAYKETLETFIEEYGSGDGLVEQVREAMQAFASDVERIGSTVDRLHAEVQRTDGRVENLDGRLAETAGELAELRESADAVDERFEELADRVERTDEDVEDLAARVDRTADEIASTDDRVDAVDERVDAVEERTDAQADRLDEVAALESRVDAMDDVEGRLDDLAEDVEALREEVEDDGSGAVDERLGDVEETLTEMEARLSALEADTTDRLDAVSERVADVEERLDEHDAWRRQFSTLLANSGSSGERDGTE